MLAAIRDATHDADADGTRRRDLTAQLERLQDLYVMGDITKPQYVQRRQALEQELERLGPPTDPQLDQAAALLADFASFWAIEPSPAERRKLIAQLFERICEHGGAIVAVRPRAGFAPYLEAAQKQQRHRTSKCGAEGGSDGTRTRDLRRDRPQIIWGRFAKMPIPR